MVRLATGPTPRPRRKLVTVLILLAGGYLTFTLLARHSVQHYGLPVTLASASLFGRSSSSSKDLAQRVFSSDLAAASSRYKPAPGFEESLPNCRVSDLVNDPITKEYGQNNVRLSRSYEGTGQRVRKVLLKALRGEPIKIAVVGGSVSSGHGIEWPLTSDNYMYKRIHQWFVDTFPKTQVDLNLDSVIPATTAFYFSYCVKETLPDDADLVLMELDVNHHDPHPYSLDATEALFRTILDLPNQPAVVYLSVFALVFQDMTHGWRHTALITQWLDIPMINMRNFYLPHLMLHPEDSEVIYMSWADYIDERHINKNGHRAMGDMTVAYLREQLCLLQRDGPMEMQGSSAVWPTNEIAGGLPRLGMLSKWDTQWSLPALNPQCRSITGTKSPLQPFRMAGFASVDRNDKKSFEGTREGDEITFMIHTVTGQAGFYFWKTKDSAFGSADCWIDDDTAPHRIREVVAYDPTWQAAIFEHTYDLWQDLTLGDHRLTCRVKPGPAGGTLFRINSVVTR